MKLALSLPEEDVEFLDNYAATHGMGSRSAVVQEAVRMLRSSELSNAYESAWSGWAEDGDDEMWNAAASDGVPGNS